MIGTDAGTLVAVTGAVLFVILLLFLAGQRRRHRKSDHDFEAHRGAAQSRTPIQIDEHVQITVYRRSVVQPGIWYPLLAFAHLAEPRPDAGVNEPDPVREVQMQARQMLGQNVESFQSVASDSRAGVMREGELRFVPVAEGIEFNPAERRFIWNETVHCEQFRMRAAATADGKTARGVLTVFSGNLLIADVPLTIRVAKDSREPREEHTEARPYRRIFASYSHRDLDIVEEFEQHARATGDSYLRDVVSLRAGERWNDQILELIKSADVFQLFWSWNAMASPLVCKEWQYALGLNRKHFIRPVYWDEPLPESPGLPPDSLRSLHFQRVYPRAGSRATPERTTQILRSARSPATLALRAAAIIAPVLALALYVTVSYRSSTFPVPPPNQSPTLPLPGTDNPGVIVPSPTPPAPRQAPVPPPDQSRPSGLPGAGNPGVVVPSPAPPAPRQAQVVGAGGLGIEELAVRGVSQIQGEFAALVEGADGKTYTLRKGDRLLDGIVKSIDAEGVVLVQDVNDPLSQTKQREVRKRLTSR